MSILSRRDKLANVNIVYTSHSNCFALKIIYFTEDGVDCSYMMKFSNVFNLKVGVGYFYSPAYLETPAKYMKITF